jgi:hypothetical protein
VVSWHCTRGSWFSSPPHVHVPGRVMIANVLTKAVARSLYLELLRLFDAYSVDGNVCPA